MRPFNVQGVVRNGQVVLEVPLDLPDGTLVTVTDYDPEDVATVGADLDDPEAREATRQFLLTLLQRAQAKRSGNSDGPMKAAG